MGYAVFRTDDAAWEERGDGRLVARLSDAFTHSRANLWRYPPGARGRRHRDLAQEEVFVVLDGTLTLLAGDPPERVEVARGGLAVIEIGTPIQLRNETDEELVMFAYGAPPETGKAEFLDEPSS